MRFPKTPEEYALTYNFKMFVGSLITAYFVAPWLPFVVCGLWVALWSWDLYLAPWLFPEVMLTTDEEATERFRAWITTNNERLEARVKALENSRKPWRWVFWRRTK